MSGAILGYKNLVDDSASVISSPETEIRDLDNLKTRQLSDIATINGDFGEIHVDFGTAQKIDLVALLGISGAQFIVSLTTRKFIAIGQVYIGNDPTFAVNLFSGAWRVDTYEGSDVSQNLYCLTGGVTGRYMKIRFYEPLNATADRSAARLWAGPGVVFTEGVMASWNIATVDSGTLESSEGQQWYENVGVKTRVLTVSVDGMSSEVAFGFEDDEATDPLAPCVHRASLYLGETGECIMLPRTSTYPWLSRLGIYGHLRDPIAISHQAGNNFSTSFTVIEER